MHLSNEILFFGGFIAFIIAVLLVDLLLIGRKKHVLSTKESAIWTGVWVGFAVAFYFIILAHGDKLHNITSFADLQLLAQRYAPSLVFSSTDLPTALAEYRHSMATEYITGYLIEYTLSLDNVFVILMILTSFSVAQKSYKVVLFWGILGAIILRCIFIFLGAAMVQKFQWTLILFGAFLVYSGIKVFIERHKTESIDVAKHPVVRFFGRWARVTPTFQDEKFFVRKEKVNYITPLFIVLIIVEFTDLIFAFDSIPAIFSITRDPYIVFFSNIFAIIGLRSLFFLVIKMFYLFSYLKEGISVLLTFIGAKLIFHSYLDEIGFKSVYSMYFILIVLAGSILLSVLFPRKETAK